jgi:laccase
LRKVGDPNNPNIELGGYWGCAYDPLTDKSQQNLETPLIKDSFQLWQRSWAVIRFEATMPGFWYFHCHETQHLMLGLQTVFNILPSKQPPVPADVPTSGWCKTVNESSWGS